MAIYYDFDRQILAKTETTEGTAIAAGATDFVDTLTDITVDFQPTTHARDLVRPGFTTIPDQHPSTDITGGNLVGVGTISFQVEASLKDASTPVATAPQWGTLLKACGFASLADIMRIGAGAITSGPILNRENLLVSASAVGQTVGTTFTGDTYIYYEDGGGITASDAVSGAVSSAAFTAAGTETAVGIAYVMDTTTGTGNNSSCSIYLWRAGQIWQFKGCRGDVSLQFNATDRVIMSFTMQGVLQAVNTGSKVTGIAINHAIPSTFNDATLKINEHGAESTAFTGANFESMTLTVGNQIALRPDANSASGYKSAIITGRAPTLSLTLDSVLGGTTSATALDFNKFRAVGTPLRVEWKAGDGMDANSMLFRAPAWVLDGKDMDSRDGIEADTITGKLTGGFYGDSVIPSTGNTRYHDDRGYDNELTIVLF